MYAGGVMLLLIVASWGIEVPLLYYGGRLCARYRIWLLQLVGHRSICASVRWY